MRYSTSSPSTIAGARTVWRNGRCSRLRYSDVDEEADREPAKPDQARRLLLDDDDEPRGSRPEAAEDREQRPVDSAQAGGSAVRGRRSPRRARLTRSATTAACAIVNESIAPNAYIVPRKFVWPGRMTAIEAIPAKTTSASHGVWKRLCSRRKTSGSCR